MAKDKTNGKTDAKTNPDPRIRKQNGGDTAAQSEAPKEKTRREVWLDFCNRYVSVIPLPAIQELEAMIDVDFPKGE